MIHHVGIAARDGEALSARYEALFGLETAHTEDLPARNLWVRFLGDGPYIEVLEPTGDGPIERFLNRHGSGLHHVAFAVADLRDRLDTVQSAGYEVIDEKPRPGAWGHDVAFLHPDTGGGVLIELLED